MQHLKILSNKETKEILKQINLNWGSEKCLDYAFFKNEKDKIFIINKEFAQIDDTKLRINSLGMYLGEIKNNELRLSIEGSQLIGPFAKKNILELTKEESKDWLKGKDICIEAQSKGFVIIRSGCDYIGTGKVKDNKILNFIPKTRRITSSD